MEETAPTESIMEAPIEEDLYNSQDKLGLGSDSLGGIEPDKVITTVFLGFETREFENSLDLMYALIEENKGYMSSSNIFYRNYYDAQRMRSGEFSIRIPRDRLNQFRGQIPEIGNLVNESSSKEDVTTYYTDTESRLKVLEIKESRLLGLLEKAEKIEDILAIENQLSDLISEKEGLQKTLVSLDDRIDYSTVNISLEEVRNISTTETGETRFIDRIGNAFSNSFYRFRVSAENLAILIVNNLPFILAGVLLLFVLYKLFKKIASPRKKEETKVVEKEIEKEDKLG